MSRRYKPDSAKVIHASEYTNRRRKAEAMAAVLRERDITAEIVERLDDDTWALLAAAVGSRPPSDVTKAWVADLLAGGDGLSVREQLDIKTRGTA